MYTWIVALNFEAHLWKVFSAEVKILFLRDSNFGCWVHKILNRKIWFYENFLREIRIQNPTLPSLNKILNIKLIFFILSSYSIMIFHVYQKTKGKKEQSKHKTTHFK